MYREAVSRYSGSLPVQGYRTCTPIPIPTVLPVCIVPVHTGTRCCTLELEWSQRGDSVFKIENGVPFKNGVPLRPKVSAYGTSVASRQANHPNPTNPRWCLVWAWGTFGPPLTVLPVCIVPVHTGTRCCTLELEWSQRGDSVFKIENGVPFKNGVPLKNGVTLKNEVPLRPKVSA
eukprot:COSAG02_NODE_386_length_23297_cov_32.396457_7_plen_175_part_00